MKRNKQQQELLINLIKKELLIDPSNFKKIAKKLNTSSYFVLKIANSINIYSRNQKVVNLEPEIENLFKLGYKIKHISKIIKLDRHVVGRILRKKGYEYSKVNKANLNSSIFQTIDNEEKAYWLGFLYADCNVGDNNVFEISLMESDLNHLEKFKKFINYSGKIYYRAKTKSYRIMFKDSTLCKNLINLGCMPRKSLILTFPTENQVPNYLINHFIRGYFDGDGSISLKYSKFKDRYNGVCSFAGTFEFLTSLKNILNNNNVLNVSKIRKTASKTFVIEMFSSIFKPEFVNFIYLNSNIYLDRKYQKYKKLFYNR